MKRLLLVASLVCVPWGTVSGQEGQAPANPGVSGRVVTLSSRAAQDPVAEAPAAGEPVRKAVSVTLDEKSGKLIVTGPDGQVQEIDIAGARGLSITSSTVVEEKDGQPRQRTFGRAVILGRDGQQVEIPLDGADGLVPEIRGALPLIMRGLRGDVPPPEPPAGILGMDGNGGDLLIVQARPYFIGLHCEPASEDLKAQLGLHDGSGLVVREVAQGSPAEEAGLQRHDVLLFADDTQLNTVEDLVGVVQKSGEDSGKLTLVLLRKGVEERIEVRPAKREVGDAQPGGDGGDPMPFRLDVPRVEMPKDLMERLAELREMGPALMLGDGDFEELRAELMRARDEMRLEFGRAADEFRKQMQEFRQQMEESRAELQKALQQMHELNRDRSQKGGQSGDDGLRP